MSFLNEIKEELFELRIKKSCCMQAEIRGVLAFGAIGYEGGILYGTDSFPLAKRLSSFLRKVCNIDFAERLDENAGSYKFFLPDNIIGEIGLAEEDGNIKALDDREEDYCCMRAFVRGAFLASGSAANPEKTYRVEIFSENEEMIDKVLGILEALGVEARKVKRKNLFVIYGNNSENASDILKVTEASGAVFKLLDVKIAKEKRNEANRQINFDMANIDRINENSKREADAIRLIEKKVGLDSLKPKLYQAAKLRLENEGASLKELCEMCDPPLAKSTLNNRLNKLIQIAKGLSDK
ncbi:MAG: DNA-binding protein WhiA [Clostridia bacterium]|nr:DNA-binding protein WhiA [Clostridia bacterium]